MTQVISGSTLSPSRVLALAVLLLVCTLLTGLPVRAAEAPKDRPQQEMALIKARLEQLISTNYRQHGATHVSVYFRDLGATPDLAIDENFVFAPASLMKVPIMMAYLKLAESDPALLNDRLTYSGRHDFTANQGIKPAQTLRPGTAYTIDELIRRMIAYSDNNALVLLHDNLDLHQLESLLRTLNVGYLPSADGGRITLKSYARLYRSLYEASYLNRSMSRRALAYLEQEHFDGGLVAGIPRGTKIAAKFGEWAGGAHSEVRHMSEVGIVYHPKHPYLIGVAVEGPDISTLSAIIRDISREVYQDVNLAAQRRQS